MNLKLFLFIILLFCCLSLKDTGCSASDFSCLFPSAVKAGYRCSGVYIGNGLVLTAAHCLEKQSDGTFNLPGKKVAFADNVCSTGQCWDEVESAGRVVECEYCIPYPNGSPSTGIWGQELYDGVDLAVCILKSNVNVPFAPVMQFGCDTEWFMDNFFKKNVSFTFVGMGCNEVDYNMYPVPCSKDGEKRAWKLNLDYDQPQSFHQGSYKLQFSGENDENPIANGDSGGPLFCLMPDGTYRVIGVLHGTSGNKVYWEPITPYVDWIESVTGRDISPKLGEKYYLATGVGNWGDNCKGAGVNSKPCPGGSGDFAKGDFVIGNAPSKPIESWLFWGQPDSFNLVIMVNNININIKYFSSLNIGPIEHIVNSINNDLLLKKQKVKASSHGSILTINGGIKILNSNMDGGARFYKINKTIEASNTIWGNKMLNNVLYYIISIVLIMVSFIIGRTIKRQ